MTLKFVTSFLAFFIFALGAYILVFFSGLFFELENKQIVFWDTVPPYIPEPGETERSLGMLGCFYAGIIWAYFAELYIGKAHKRAFHVLCIILILWPVALALLVVLHNFVSPLFFYAVHPIFGVLFLIYVFLVFSVFYSAYKKVHYALICLLVFPVSVVFTQAYILTRRGAETKWKKVI